VRSHEIESRVPELERRARQAASAAVRDRAIVDEAVGHALEMIWAKRAGVETERVLKWVGAVAYRRAIDEARRQKRIVQPPAAGADDPDWLQEIKTHTSPLSMSDERAYQEALSWLLDFLSAKQREALTLWLEGQDYTQMAEHLGVAPGTARKRVHDAKEALREALGDRLDDFVPHQRAR